MKALKIASLALTVALTGCSGSSNSGNNACEDIANKYFEEYQAYVNSREANGGEETPEVMDHYYASGDYYVQFMEMGCEEQGYTLD